MAVLIRRDRPADESGPVKPGGREEAAAASADLELDPDLTTPPEWTTMADRRTTRDKFAAGLRGLKHAIRGDSSFFVHAYRGLLIALTATLLGVAPMGWCLLGLSGSLVLVAELTHSAIDTLARAVGDPEEQALKAAGEIAAAGVLVAVFSTAAIAVAVFALRLIELLS